MRLGVHVPIAKGLLAAAKQAERLGCETVQIFASNPNAWKFSELHEGEAEAFCERLRELDIHPLFVHTAYLVNLAAPDPGVYMRSVESLRRSVRRAEEVFAPYVVTHVGSHRGDGYSTGVERIGRALLDSLEQRVQEKDSLADRPRPMVLLENSAGAGNSIGWRFEHFADILSCLGEGLERIGFCLDIAHLYAAGYDVATGTGLEAAVCEFDRLVGLSRLHLVHLNDTRVELGSRRDRHWHIGHGSIGLAGFGRIINHPLLCHLPGILETPMEEGWDERNLEVVRGLAQE